MLSDMEEVIERIVKMEQYFDQLLENPHREDRELMLSALREYCDSGLWLKDYERDEKGLIPKDLKRGVLSQDGLYDLLCEAER